MSESSSGRLVLLGLVGLAVYSCSGSDPDEPATEEVAYTAGVESGDQDSSDADEAEAPERAAFNEDAAREAAKEEVSDESYASIGRPYGCTIDCSGHDAGFAWAAQGHEDRGLSNSRSFDEGQEAYEEAVDERVDEMRNDYEAGADDD